MRHFLIALSFLSVLPVRFRSPPTPAEIGRSRFWFPIVGAFLGLFLGSLTAMLLPLGTPPVRAFLILLAWVGVTGALHLDGLCDLFDGLFGGQTPADRLRIMKDPHLGTFGFAAGAVLLLGKFTCLSAIATEAWGAWIVGMSIVLARCLVLCMAAGATYPRSEGTGKSLIEAVPTREAFLFAGVGGLATVLGTIGAMGWRWPDIPPDSLPLFAIPFVAVLLLRGLCQQRLGGITGDCLGAAIELSELLFLLTATFLHPHFLTLAG